MREVEGNLFDNLDGDQRILLPHVSNDQRKWRSGFVVPLGQKFPDAKQRYLNAPTIEMTQGETQFVLCDYRPMVVVANMVAQTLIMPKSSRTPQDRPLSYRSLTKCMEEVGTYARHTSSRIVCPRFASCRAGGDWEFVKELIKDFWVDRGIDVTVFYIE